MEKISRPTIAIVLFIIGMGLIPVNDVVIKLMSDRISIFEILALRSAFIVLIVFCFPATLRSLMKLSYRNWMFLSVRGICIVSAMLLFFLSLASLGLAEATSIFFTAPLMISLMSVPMLGEKLGIYRISAALVGGVGVLLIVQPGGDGFKMAYLLTIVSAISYAAFQLITRYLKDEVDLSAMVGVQNLIYLAVGLIGLSLVTLIDPTIPDGKIWNFMLRPFVSPTPTEIAHLIVAGLIVLFLSIASANVYSNVEATYVAPFEYAALPFSIIWGILIWNDWPSTLSWIGMALILAGGIFMIYRENHKKKPIASAVPMRSSATNSASIDDEEHKSLPFCF